MKKNRLMDHERKDYLGAMEKRLGAMETRLGANMVTKQDLERVDAKIDGAVQLLINEMSNRFGEVGQRGSASTASNCAWPVRLV